MQGVINFITIPFFFYKNLIKVGPAGNNIFLRSEVAKTYLILAGLEMEEQNIKCVIIIIFVYLSLFEYLQLFCRQDKNRLLSVAGCLCIKYPKRNISTSTSFMMEKHLVVIS